VFEVSQRVQRGVEGVELPATFGCYAGGEVPPDAVLAVLAGRIENVGQGAHEGRHGVAGGDDIAVRDGQRCLGIIRVRTGIRVRAHAMQYVFSATSLPRLPLACGRTPPPSSVGAGLVEASDGDVVVGGVGVDPEVALPERLRRRRWSRPRRGWVRPGPYGFTNVPGRHRGARGR